MPRCEKCFHFFPPNFMHEIEGTEDQQCIFCMVDKKVISYNKDGKEIQYSKKECINEYKTFLKKLKETPNVAKTLAKGVKPEIK